MASNESEIKAILGEPRWSAPGLVMLERTITPIIRDLESLAQPSPATWSGAAANSAAASYDQIRTRYRKLRDAVEGISAAVDGGNAARDAAEEDLELLPSTEVPWQVHTAAAAARFAGKAVAWLPIPSPWQYASVAVDQAVGIYQRWLNQKREIEAHRALLTLRAELQVHHARLINHAHDLFDLTEVSEREEVSDETGGTGWRIPPPPADDTQYPLPPGFEPGPASAPNPIPDPPRQNDPRLEFTNVKFVGQEPGFGYVPRESGRPSGWLQRGSDGTATVTGSVGSGRADFGGPGIGSTSEYTPIRRPNVDSAGTGTIGSPGLAGGLLGGGGLAGGAAMRWGSRTGVTGAAGAHGLGPGGAGGAGGPGGLLGVNGANGASAAGNAATRAASGMAGGRGLVGGGPRGASGPAGLGGPGGAGGAGGSGGAGAVPRNGMMAGGTGGRDSGNKNAQKSGLGGHIAPKFEDDDNFISQSDSARAGSRDDEA